MTAPNVLISTADMDRKEWLEQRKKGIGGSDASAVAGFNKYRSPIQVYLEKIGEAPDMDEPSEAAYWGNVMEDVVAREFATRTGMKVRKRNAILVHPEHTWMLANVDRLIVGKNEGLECKTASAFLSAQWDGEEIPDAYLLQCQHYMAVTGYDAWWIAVLVGGNKFVHKRIERDQELIDNLIEIERAFWEDHVLAAIPPEMDGSEASTVLLSAMHPMSEPDSKISLPAESSTLAEALLQVKSELKDLTERKNEYENKLKAQMGSNEKGEAGTYTIRWKSYTQNRVDSKRLKEECPDIYTRYSKETNARKFEVKEAAI
ncbi:YqaJ viral recombinase family protein [Aureibacillus halotolerans]|uniref:Putative phage-type endonuclease n=1 Tax=Aureibacillus halotolerans TaxID=1508390 RepID=A0A4R6TYF4_9BACI|nr:YqaJ viral recombinase family protein [Aureibacillus halotolerans]TDQ35245.1 putative phage-type endonuclease [Aureibacillus halotolerans]